MNRRSIYVNGIITDSEVVLLDNLLGSELNIVDDSLEIEFSYNAMRKLFNPNLMIIRLDNYDEEIIEHIKSIYQPS